MKKVFISLLCVAATVSMIVSCGEKYEEPTGNEFRGTWVYVGSVPDSLSFAKNGPVFIQIREIGGEKVMMFFTNARYDSSFVYREEDSRKSGAVNLFTRRIKDSGFLVTVVMPTGPDGKPLWNPEGTGPLILIDSIYTALKPVSIDSTYKEKYFGTYSFAGQGELHLAKYRAVEEKPQVEDAKLIQDDIFRR